MGCGASKGGKGEERAESAGSGEHASTVKGKKVVPSLGNRAKAPDASRVARVAGERSAADHASAVSDGDRWTDAQFPPAESSLELEDKVDGLMWVRPEAICENPRLVTDGFDDGDVVQGQLGSCYFLAALSIIAARDDLLDVVIPRGAGFQFASKGIFTFRFFKFGRWVEVVIDDFVPATKRGPAFATGKDPNELWVTYMEKAYAKLHGTYQAIVGGWVSDALVDLTGGVPDVLYFDDEDTAAEVRSGKLFDRLEAMFASEDYLLGCAMSTSGTREQDTGQGILQGHAYGILEVRRHGKLRMLRCRNPWGCSEWSGPKSDEDTKFWTAKNLAAFDHSLGDDGTFWIEYADFAKQFNKVYACRVVDPDRFRTVSFASSWVKGSTAGGCVNNRDTWANNPQYRLIVPEDAEVILSVQQPDPRVTGEKGTYIGMAVFAAPDGSRTTSYRPVHKTKISNLREQTITTTLRKGQYNVMPFTFDAGEECKFVVSARSTAEIGLVSHQPGETPMDGSAPPPSGPPPAMDPSIAAAGAGEDPATPSKKIHYDPDDNGQIGALAKKYLDQLGQRYPMLQKVDSAKVAKYVGMGEKVVRNGLKSLFG